MDFIMSNRYTRRDDGPYIDQTIRRRNLYIYIYDNNVDLENPSAILEGLELLCRNGNSVTLEYPIEEFVLTEEANEIECDFETALEYYADTKRYIDVKASSLRMEVDGEGNAKIF